jgi:hypothetical protein
VILNFSCNFVDMISAGIYPEKLQHSLGFWFKIDERNQELFCVYLSLSVNVDHIFRAFRSDRQFLLDSWCEEDACFLHCSLKSIITPQNVKVLVKSCFASSTLTLITLEEISTKADRAFVFLHCSLKSICIPLNVEILSKSCFYGCKLELLPFESESRIDFNEQCELSSVSIPFWRFSEGFRAQASPNLNPDYLPDIAPLSHCK